MRDVQAGARPTVLTLSVLDQKEAFQDDEDGVFSHACLVHYMIDGHHKAFAAAQVGLPITALSFVALDKGASLPEKAEAYAVDICSRSVEFLLR